ncbi:amidohydrolase [Lentzea sp. JNUCC 0626]|uniref:amidohydrolase n=1 Tax=Lentzea sp. JNUCC 0626 TaxID=3367513 RepID=UPI0037490EC7
MIRPSLVVLADTIHTVDPSRPSASAIAVDGDTIVAVGTRAEAARWQAAEVLDLGAATVVPGFVDAHTHPLKGASRRWGTVDLAGATSVEEIAARVEAVARTKGPDSWVTGHSLTFDAFGGQEIRASHFESAFGGRPGYLLFRDAHSMVANRRALEIAGITGARDYGNNSRVVVEDGTPTGYLVEDPMTEVSACVPALSFEERKQAVLSTLEGFARAGYTGVHQLNIEPGDVELLQALEAEGDLPVRIRISPLWRATDDWESSYRSYLGLQGVGGRRWVVEGIKLMLDGTVGHGSAWLSEPATDGSCTLPLWMPASRYTETLHALARHGIPTATHAIGDRAVEFVLDSVASIPADFPPVVHRIEHVETIPDPLVPRFAELGVAASMQPTHLLDIRPDQTDTWSRKLGPARARNAYRVKDLIDSGAVVALGSDWPVVESDPREILAAAMARPVGQSQCLTAFESLRAFTQQVWASIGLPEHGVIRPGALADLTVFDGDPLAVSPSRLTELRVLMTVVAGTPSTRKNPA